jgi:hypothetical protein
MLAQAGFSGPYPFVILSEFASPLAASGSLSIFSGLEELNQVARGIDQPDLRASRARHNVIAAELYSLGVKPRYFGFEISYLQFNPIPAAGYRFGTHRTVDAGRSSFHRVRKEPVDVRAANPGEW